jgi:hypothetical protein
MKPKVIKSDFEYQKCLNWLDLQLDKYHTIDSPEDTKIRKALLLSSNMKTHTIPFQNQKLTKTKKSTSKY